MAERCAVPGCGAKADLVYLDHGICVRCWNRLTAEDQPADALARVLGIPVAGATETEGDMSETTVAAEPAAEKETVMASKKSAKPKAATNVKKAAKAPKPTREKKPKDATRVFAMRVTDAELAAIHKAAGPRNATRFIRAVAAAFAAEDEAAFRTVVKEAKEVRA